MTPKEKAIKLIDSMTFSCKECDNAKLAALIAIDEILFITQMYNDTYAETTYWQEVKKEIETL